ncbi:MAG: 6-carboxytetrahydropterin synthase [Phycisphaerales bacterium]|nr:6-carboxytetrahydropterin synthase [Phycisphaerales bacterium]
MYDVSVTRTFVATHQLRYPDGTLEELHEHVWEVTVTYAGPALDATGLLVDFVPLAQRMDEILSVLHEQNLNHVRVFRNHSPSAEHVALYVAEQLVGFAGHGARLTCVAVVEAPGCVARYYPPGER